MALDIAKKILNAEANAETKIQLSRYVDMDQII